MEILFLGSLIGAIATVYAFFWYLPTRCHMGLRAFLIFVHLTHPGRVTPPKDEKTIWRAVMLFSISLVPLVGDLGVYIAIRSDLKTFTDEEQAQ